MAADDTGCVTSHSRRSWRGLQQLGWTDGRNVRIDTRWAAGDADRHAQIRGGTGRAGAGRHPGHGEPDRGGIAGRRPAPCRLCSLTLADPVGAGFVDSLARPGGNATGFILFEYGISAKWLELLKELAPRVLCAAMSSVDGTTTL